MPQPADYEGGDTYMCNTVLPQLLGTAGYGELRVVLCINLSTDAIVRNTVKNTETTPADKIRVFDIGKYREKSGIIFERRYFLEYRLSCFRRRYSSLAMPCPSHSSRYRPLGHQLSLACSKIHSQRPTTKETTATSPSPAGRSARHRRRQKNPNTTAPQSKPIK